MAGRINQDIRIYYPTGLSDVLINELVRFFTILKMPLQAKTTRGDVLNVSRFFTHSGLFTNDAESDKYEIVPLQIYYWKNANINEFISYIIDDNNLTYYPIFEYDGRNNFANNVQMLKDRIYDVIVVFENGWASAQFSYYLDLAYELDCAAYFDTGLSINSDMFAMQRDALAGFLAPQNKKYGWGIINTPFNYHHSVSLGLPAGQYNTLVSAGYIAMKDYGGYIDSYVRTVRDGEALRPPRLTALVPMSAMLAGLLQRMYAQDIPYHSVINRSLGGLFDGVDIIYTMDALENMRSQGVIGPNIINKQMYAYTDVTPHILAGNSRTMLYKEYVARLAIDMARHLSMYLQFLVGTNFREQDLKQFEYQIERYVYTNFLAKSQANEEDITIEVQKSEGNKVTVNILYKVPNTVEYINILSVVS